MVDIKGNLENIGKILSETAEVVGKKTEEAVEIQKNKSKIRGLKRGNDRDLKDIGKMVYEKFKKNEVLDTTFIELCEAIEAREEAITEHKKKIAEIKGLDVCPECKAHIEPDTIFCPKCGAKVEQEIFDEESEDVFED